MLEICLVAGTPDGRMRRQIGWRRRGISHASAVPTVQSRQCTHCKKALQIVRKQLPDLRHDNGDHGRTRSQSPYSPSMNVPLVLSGREQRDGFERPKAI